MAKSFKRQYKLGKGLILLSLIFAAVIVLIVLIVEEYPKNQTYIGEQEHQIQTITPHEGYQKYLPDKPRKRVLLLHSYQSELSWSESISKGIKKGLRDAIWNLHINTEYMNSREFPEQLTNPYFLDNLIEKYSNIKFDVIISADNNALEFLRLNRNKIFGNTPVVFTGVNGFEPSMIENMDNITGVIEEIKSSETIEIALDLVPKTKKVYIISDRSKTGQIVKNQMVKAIEDYPTKLEYEVLTDYTSKELAKKVSTLEENSIVILLVWSVDRNGNLIKYRESKKYISLNCNVPLFGVWDFTLRDGVIGGAITTGYDQGFEASKLAIRIINGEDADSIPIVADVKTKNIFDYRQFKRYKLKTKLLPPHSIIFNYPVNPIMEHAKVALISISTFLFMITIIFLLFFNMNSRKIAQNQLANNQIKLKKMVVELAAKNEELESIIYASYHDLRSPLVNINGFVHELFEDCKKLNTIMNSPNIRKETRNKVSQVVDEQIPAQVNLIIDNSRKMSSLQESLLEVSKIGQVTLEKVQIDMNQLIYRILESIPAINDGDVDVYIKTLPECFGDIKMLEKVFRNIIENAVTFCKPTQKPEITIYGSEKENYVEYNFEDNGIGIERKNINDIFRLFYRLSPVQDSEHMGLGLTIAKRIISKHEGEITVESSLERGSIFTIKIPKKQ